MSSSVKMRARTMKWHSDKQYETWLAATTSLDNHRAYCRAAARWGHTDMRPLGEFRRIIDHEGPAGRFSYEKNHCKLAGGSPWSRKIVFLVLNSPTPDASVHKAFRMEGITLVYLQKGPTIEAVGKLIKELLPHVAFVIVSRCGQDNSNVLCVVNKMRIDASDCLTRRS
jgi:hypothetical protein